MSTDHRKLSAFKIADEFDVRVYTSTRIFQSKNVRAAVPDSPRGRVAPANIVEGCARDSDREHARFFGVVWFNARGDYLIDLASRSNHRPQCG